MRRFVHSDTHFAPFVAPSTPQPNPQLLSIYQRHFVQAVCDEIVELHAATVHRHRGSYEDFLAGKSSTPRAVSFFSHVAPEFELTNSFWLYMTGNELTHLTNLTNSMCPQARSSGCRSRGSKLRRHATS